MGTSPLRRLCLLLALFALGSVACGEDAPAEGNTVYLHVINAYEGGGELSIYGPDGDIVIGVPSGEQGPGAIPMDRTRFDNTLNFALQGLPGLVPLDFDLYSLYPGEHVTLLVQRRVSLNELDVSLLRHTLVTYDSQNPSFHQCALEITNAMSLSNTFTAGRYDFATEWRVSQARVDANYNRDSDKSAPTECGDIELSNLTGGSEIDAIRQRHYVEEIDASPWFFPVNIEGGSGIGSRLALRKGFHTVAGQVSARRGTTEYRQCLGEAVELGESMDMNDPCGPGAISGASLNLIQARECTNYADYNVSVASPGVGNSITYFYSTPENNCDLDMRLRTASVDSVFSKDGKIQGVSIEGDAGQWKHVVVWGRPVGPGLFFFSGDEDGLGYRPPVGEPQ